jgi:diguanylate cyclase (GGDEF)-like protein
LSERSPVRVLLVEDNPGDARLVEILLSEAGTGFEVRHVEALGGAVEELDRSPFDVILLDLSLPDSSGLETVERVRTAVPEMPVVVLSGRDDEETALQALQGGVEDYLVKGRGDGELMARAIRYAIERKKAEEKLAYLAQYDPLTGLANRALFHDRLEQALARAGRDGDMIALMFVDLDRFKAINDSLGHTGGDSVLREVARRIQGRLRGSDTVARLGGDEFAVILEDLSEAQDAARVAEDLVSILSTPFISNGHDVPVAASVGIAVHPPSGQDALLKDADAAMYRAKQRGGNNHQFYTEEMNVQASAQLALERDLRRALEREEFLLHYQPQVDLTTGEVVGAEALLRWRHDERGLVSPAEFIPVLEDIGLIVPVGAWVLGEACRQAREWRDAGLAPVRIAVNLSARQLGREGLVGSVEDALEESGLDPSCLELEITESMLVENGEAGLGAVELLKKAVGRLRISIDDFGTGYSSLYRLKALPVERLKIDQSFIRGVATDPGDAAITAAVIALSHDLRLQVTAEGVETAEQLAFLRERACDEAQGFYFSRPLPPDEFARLLESDSPLADVASTSRPGELEK